MKYLFCMAGAVFKIPAVLFLGLLLFLTCNVAQGKKTLVESFSAIKNAISGKINGNVAKISLPLVGISFIAGVGYLLAKKIKERRLRQNYLDMTIKKREPEEREVFLQKAKTFTPKRLVNAQKDFSLEELENYFFWKKAMRQEIFGTRGYGYPVRIPSQ